MSQPMRKPTEHSSSELRSDTAGSSSGNVQRLVLEGSSAGDFLSELESRTGKGLSPESLQKTRFVDLHS